MAMHPSPEVPGPADPVSEEGRDDLSVSMVAANVYSMAIILPVVAVLAGAYASVWGSRALFDGVAAWMDRPLLLLAALILGVVVHEGLHGLAWACFGRKPLRAITFGFQLKTLTPYAHCREPMPVGAYRWGALAPGLVLGVLPALAGIATGHGLVVWFGLFFTLAAGGDALILWLLRRVEAGRLVQDHPSRAGCYVYGEPGARAS